MSKWIPVSEATKMLCCHKEMIYRAAREHNWEHRLGERPKNGGKTPTLYLAKDVKRLKEYRERSGRKAGAKRTYYQAIDIVYWADRLETYPSLDEIKARTTDKYRVPDIVSVIENRVYRGITMLEANNGAI